MNKDIRDFSEECCKLWNDLKDDEKHKMIDYLIDGKMQLAELKAKVKEFEENATFYQQYLREHKIRASLEKANGELKAENERLSKKLQKVENMTVDDLKLELDKLKELTNFNITLDKAYLFRRCQSLVNEKNKIQQQLKEKDEEIEDLKAKLKSAELCFHITNSPTKAEMSKRITKQVCEKIRKIIKSYDFPSEYEKDRVIYSDIIYEFLDQIKKGEN